MAKQITPPHLISANWLSAAEYYEILLNIELSSVHDKPPVLPQPGELYVFGTHDSTKRDDWKSDQYRWRQKGHKNLPAKSPLVECYYYDTFEGKGFQKRAYMLFQQEGITAYLVVVHYVGSLNKVIHKAHGNRKVNTNIKHAMTAKSQLRAQKAELTEPPHKVYKRLTAGDIHPAYAKVLLPRDRSQVSNTVLKERERKLLSNDDIVGLYLMSDEIEHFIRKIELLPFFYSIMYSDDMMMVFGVLKKFHSVIFYDTTFNLGDFYVSPLTFKHEHFVNAPVIPLGYLLHHTKNAEVHESFFRCIKKACPNIVNIPIVTDREGGISLAITKALKNSKHFFCWNHIQQDIKNWVKKQKNTKSDDIKAYVNHTWDLLDSNSLEECKDKYNDMSGHWSEQFKEYFDKYILEDIYKSGKWELEKYGLYVPGSGITINAAESFNAVLKRCLDRREVKAQVLALTIQQLDLYYQREIMRGYCNLGNYRLKREFSNLETDPSRVWFPKKHLPLEKLPYIFHNKDFENLKKPSDEIPYTRYSISKMLVLQGGVKLIPEDQVFLITSTDKRNLVKLFPSESCSCGAKRGCHHIEAARISIGIEEQSQRKLKLSTLMKRKRGYRAGRKGEPRTLSVVEAAPDTILKDNSKGKTSILVPTLIREKQVKERFFDPFATSTPHSKFLDLPSHISDYVDEKDITLFGSTPTSVEKGDDLPIQPLPSDLESDTDKDGNLAFSFRKKYEENKQFLIFGRAIYPSDLKVLVPDEVKTSEDFYLSDIIFDVYFPILINQYEGLNNSVEVFSVEGYIINYLDTFNEAFHRGVEYFLEYSLIYKDILIFPLTKYQHCTVFVLFKRLKTIIYLDSLSRHSYPSREVEFVMKVYQTCCRISEINFCINDWKIHIPPDVPKQNNSYDCGVYCCLFVEMLLSRNVQLLNNQNNLLEYRHHIRDSIISVMNGVEILAPLRNPVKKNINKIHIPELQLKQIYYTPPTNTTTLEFLACSIGNYWEENTISICYLGDACQNIGKTMVLCDNCDHWYHLACLGVEKNTLPIFFKCPACTRSIETDLLNMTY